jgi:hypothetical protein
MVTQLDTRTARALGLASVLYAFYATAPATLTSINREDVQAAERPKNSTTP